MKSEDIRFSKIEDFKKKFSIPIIYCNTLNDPVAVGALKKTGPDIVVFTGGGLVRKDVLNNSGAGILNCHIGVLPQYRGMDVVEWPILKNDFGAIGMTVHFMDEGLDTGDILQVNKIKVLPNQKIRHVRERFEPIMCRKIVKACHDYLNGELNRIPQQHEDGKQYFIMHPDLMGIAENRLKKMRNY
jgi:methionyl-tRNA formyltransferase